MKVGERKKAEMLILPCETRQEFRIGWSPKPKKHGQIKNSIFHKCLNVNILKISKP